MPATQDARLSDRNANLVATVKVPAFPNNPQLVHWQGRYFVNGMIGYGVDYLTYTEVGIFDAA